MWKENVGTVEGTYIPLPFLSQKSGRGGAIVCCSQKNSSQDPQKFIFSVVEPSKEDLGAVVGSRDRHNRIPCNFSTSFRYLRQVESHVVCLCLTDTGQYFFPI